MKDVCGFECLKMKKLIHSSTMINPFLYYTHTYEHTCIHAQTPYFLQRKRLPMLAFRYEREAQTTETGNIRLASTWNSMGEEESLSH